MIGAEAMLGNHRGSGSLQLQRLLALRRQAGHSKGFKKGWGSEPEQRLRGRHAIWPELHLRLEGAGARPTCSPFGDPVVAASTTPSTWAKPWGWGKAEPIQTSLLGRQLDCAGTGVCVCGGGGESGLLRIGTSLLNSRQNSGSAPKIWSLDCDPRRVVYVCHLEQVP
jgi:hypothetical protein